jgi:hypothetical protein
VREIKERAKGIPLVFREGLKNLKTHWSANVDEAVGQIQDNIARSIWARLPAKSRDDLRRDNFELPSKSALFEAFFKSGITRNKTGSLKDSLRVPSWLSIWKTEAKLTK